MEKLDVVYILRNSGTRWGNNEIRYSVRSIDGHFDFGNLWIVGKMPKFFDDKKVHLIEAEDIHSNKIKNAIAKISKACRERRISQEFILMNDDFFFNKRKKEIEYFNKGKLRITMKNHETKGGYYYKAIKNTVSILKDMGIKDPLDFEVHYPIVFDKDKFLEMVASIDEREVFLFRSVYGNLNVKKSKYRRDVKVFNIKQFKSKSKLDFISTDDRVVMKKEAQKWFSTTFKNRSRFERIPKTGYFCSMPMFFEGVNYNPGDILVGEVPEKIVIERKLKKINRVFY